MTCRVLLFAAGILIAGGCRTESTDSGQSDASSASAPSRPSVPRGAARPEAVHIAEFRHQFPEGKPNGNGASGSIRPMPVEGRPFFGFDKESYVSETEYQGTTKSVRFEMRLREHRDGKDVYEVTRTVTMQVEQDGRLRKSADPPQTVTVEYDGREQTVFDDEHGVSSFHPVPVGSSPAAPNE